MPRESYRSITEVARNRQARERKAKRRGCVSRFGVGLALAGFLIFLQNPGWMSGCFNTVSGATPPDTSIGVVPDSTQNTKTVLSFEY